MAIRVSILPGYGVVVEDSTTRTSLLPGYGVVVETAEEAAPGGANPKGPLGHPLHGPLGGPIGA